MSKTILITGASTGIGAETARYLARDSVILLQYSSSKLKAQNVAREVESMGGKAFVFQADLRSEEGCTNLFRAVAEKVSHLDALINNAGAALHKQSVRRLEWTMIHEVFTLNIFAVMKLTSLCIPLLEAGTKSCIINLTSVSARTGSPGNTMYAAAKGALDTFTRGAARELAPTIRVNAVAPGIIDTPFHIDTPPEQMQALKEASPLKMIGRPAHIAQAIGFLLENEFITGETLDINGGYMMR